MQYTQQEYQRYARQMILKEVGPLGQNQLRQAKVLLVGAGGLGSPAALYLAAAGVGTIGLVDEDEVSLSNLQRQVLYTTADVGRKKVVVAKERLEALNPHVHVDIHASALSHQNAKELISAYDIVMDGTDNFKARYLINDVCVELGKPFVYGSVFQFEGQVSVFAYQGGPCFRCLFPKPIASHEVPSCTEAGVLGVVPGLVSLTQVNEIIKMILGRGDVLSGHMTIFDALNFSWDKMHMAKNPNCPCCSNQRDEAVLGFVEPVCAIQDNSADFDRVDIKFVKNLLDNPSDDVVLVDVRTPDEWALGTLKNAIRYSLQEIEQSTDKLKPFRDKSLVLICHSGKRSQKACEILHRAGFTKLKDLQGGMHAWYEKYMTHLE